MILKVTVNLAVHLMRHFNESNRKSTGYLFICDQNYKKNENLLEFFSRNKPLLGGLGALLIGTAGYGYFSHIQECPITKRKRFVALTQDQVL